MSSSEGIHSPPNNRPRHLLLPAVGATVADAAAGVTEHGVFVFGSRTD